MVIFIVVAAAEFMLFYALPPESFVMWQVNLVAKILYGLLKMFSAPVVLSGNMLRFPAMNLEIVYECTGAFAFFIFSACVFGYPANVKSKIIGHIMGIVGISIINFGRLLVLSWAALHARGIFDFIHKYLWQATFIILVMVLWVWWVNSFTGEKKKKSEK